MAASSIRFGPGSTREVGMDFANMKAKKVVVITDNTIAKLPPMKTAIEALEREGIQYEVFSDVRVEPKDYSVKKAIEFGKRAGGDAYLAVGGGSVMDTAKMVNLYTCFPEADFLDFVSI
jgi:hydroxyacid-oxoacid transhydrogenase